jgi:hypothetical protein
VPVKAGMALNAVLLLNVGVGVIAKAVYTFVTPVSATVSWSWLVLTKFIGAPPELFSISVQSCKNFPRLVVVPILLLTRCVFQ